MTYAARCRSCTSLHPLSHPSFSISEIISPSLLMSERKGRHGLENCEVDLAKSCVHGLRTTVLLIETVAGSSDSVEGVHRALDVEDCEAAARALYPDLKTKKSHISVLIVCGVLSH
ncbi:hypothetical protein AAZV13_15G096300 [Glycine max]